MDELFKLTAGLEEDLRKFKEETERFKNGDVSPAEYRAFRVPMGIYEQRENGKYMMRVRLPAGILPPAQMRVLAGAAREAGSDILHVTTRQDIQIHNVPLDNLHPALQKLHRAGLSTKGGGGNTVRNITACHGAGVCAAEAFDVTPHVVALTEFLLADPVSFRLPRKFKIGFSGCPKDCDGATVTDVGLIAKKRSGEPGFAVYVGGGMGAHCRVAEKLEEFVPAEQIHHNIESIKRVFNRHGNRKNKNRARLRFLIEELGLERFRELYERELTEIRRNGLPGLHIRDIPERNNAADGNATEPPDGFEEWRRHNVEEQKQSGFHLVHIPLLLGDISAGALESLAGIVEAGGERRARATTRQNLVIRWVHESELAWTYEKLKELKLAGAAQGNIVACAGASTCRLGICLSRGLALAIAGEFSNAGLDPGVLEELNINISGCPNSCGRHPVGDIGLYGAARRLNDRLVPHYVIQLGGKTAEGETRLAEGDEAVPARNVPAFIVDFLRAYKSSPRFPDYNEFLESEGRGLADRLIAEYGHVPSFGEDKNFYYDWGAEAPFTLEGRGPGECGAGVFDLIQVDLDSARAALREGKLYPATVLAARSLLITRGVEAGNHAEALARFDEHFIRPGIVGREFDSLIGEALRCASGSGSGSDAGFDAGRDEVSALIETMEGLYDRMDQSLILSPEAPPEEKRADTESRTPPPASSDSDMPKIDREADFRGVACPLNYVKTKLLLEKMQAGQVLSVLLNDEGAKNVPRSAEQDGCEVVLVAKEKNHWQVILRKK